MKSKWWLALVCFLAGIAVGIFVATTSRTPGISPAGLPEVFREPEPKVLPPPPPPVRAGAVPKAESPVRERLSAIAELNLLLRMKISVPLLVGEVLDEDFVKVYGLTTSEVAQLKASFSAAKKRIAELEAKHALIESKGENGYSISIPPFPQEGGAVYDGLLQSIHDVLGDERFAAYRASSNDVDSTAFGRFGLSETTIVIRPLGKGELSTSTFSTADANGPMKVQVDTDPAFFPRQYPEIYRMMVAAGLWKGTTHE